MPDTHDYPLAEVLGTGDTIHQARPVGLLGSRIETRCGLQGGKTGRDGGTWCPECVALERADERDGNESAAEFAHDEPHPTPTEIADRMLALCQRRGRASLAHVESLRNLIHKQAEQLAAETAELGRVNKRAGFLNDALKGLRQQAIEAVKERNVATARAEANAVVHDRWKAMRIERNEATARAEKAEAERDQQREYVAALNEAQVSLQSSSFEVGWWKGFKATPTAGVYTQAYLDTVEYADGLRALAADAVQDGLSATKTGRDGNCPWCGTLQKLGVDGLVLPHEHPTYADECPGTTRRPSGDTTEDSGE